MSEAAESGKSAETDTVEKPERLVFFSDAVAAIALTLLALDLPLPKGSTDQELWHDLSIHWHSDFFPFLLSFVVIAAFWNAHHELFRQVTRLGTGIVPLNFVFLLMIVSLPWVTRVLGDQSHHQIGVVLYAAVLTLIGLTLAALAILARREHLNRPGSDRDLAGLTIGMISLAVVFAASIPVGFVAPDFTTWLWLILAVTLRGIGQAFHRIRQGRHPET